MLLPSQTKSEKGNSRSWLMPRLLRLSLGALCGLVLFVAPSASAQALAGYSQLATGISATTYTDTTCADSQKCFYYITAVNSLGESAPSAAVNATIPATSTVHSATLTWTASAGTGITYNVYRGTVPLPPSGLTVTAQ